MSEQQSIYPRLQSLHQELELRVAESSKAELEQCARLLAMYLAVYKRRFGEISVSDSDTLSEHELRGDSGAEVFAMGLVELKDMLQLVGDASASGSTSACSVQTRTIN